MKRALYYLCIVAQGVTLAITLANVIYCFSTNSLVSFGITSYPLLFVPFYKIYNGGSLYNILAFIVFASFSVFVYVKSTKEFLDRNLRKGVFIGVNYLWSLFAYSSCSSLLLDLDFADFVGGGEYYVTVLLMLLGLVAMVVKTYESHDVIRADRRDGEDFLPEEFQLDAKSYKQIERTAKGMPWFAFVCFVISLVVLYVGGEKFISMLWISFMYIATAFLMIINFFICINQTKKFEKRTGLKMPSEDFLKKINVLQITTFILFVLSYLFVLVLSTKAFVEYL